MDGLKVILVTLRQCTEIKPNHLVHHIKSKQENLSIIWAHSLFLKSHIGRMQAYAIGVCQ